MKVSMEGMEGKDDFKKTVSHIVKHFYKATGINCAYIDDAGETVVQNCGCSSRCFCCEQTGIIKKGTDCRNVHLYGKSQSEIFGGKYIYFCPAGLTWFISPVIYENNVAGAILGGPLLMYAKQEYLEMEIIPKFHPGSEALELIRKKLRSVPQVSPEKVGSLSEVLYMLSCFNGFYESGSNFLDRRSQSVQQQGEIGEMIKEIKLNTDGKREAYPLETENELLSAISDGDKQTASRLLNEILGHIFFSSGGSFEIIRARVLELVVLLSRAAVSGGADIENIFGLNYRYISEINRFTNVDDLCYWLSEIMNKFISHIFQFNEVKHLDVIYKTTEYIRRKYMEKLTLDEAAAYVYLSPSYFSKIFKEEMKCNFNSYLNKIRVEQSKRLLLADDVKLVDVAGLAGFEDQSYFSKVFKKFTGITPKKYRETRGRKIFPEIKTSSPGEAN